MKKATQEQAKALTLVFWDIIKCPVPDGCDPRVIRPSIKRLLENNGYCGALTVTAIGKLEDVPTDTLKALYSSGIHLTIGPFGSSDITGLIEMDETANFMVISYSKACPGLFKTLQEFGYNPLRPFPFHSLDSLIKEDSGVLEEETGESASWHCLVCPLDDPPARGFNNFITHLSNVDHKLRLSTTKNTVRRPPVDLSRGPILTDLKTAKSEGETLVYWDIKLCPVPHDYDASLVGPRIKRFLKKEGFSGPLTIVAIGVLTDVPTDILRALYSSGITFHIVPYGSADIPSLIFECCHRNGPLRNIMVISNDEYLTNQCVFVLSHSVVEITSKMEDVPYDILRGVHSSGISLDCIPYGFLISLERHIYEFIDWNPPPANVMVISDAKHSASDDVFGLQSKGYNIVEPPCDSHESFFLADSGALEATSEYLLGDLYCWVCCRHFDNLKNFTFHQRKLLKWSQVEEE